MLHLSKLSFTSASRLTAIAAALLVAGCGDKLPSLTGPVAEIQIGTFTASNSSKFDRNDVLLTWELAELDLSAEAAKHLVARSGDTLLTGQITDSDGDSKADQFSALINLGAGAQREIKLVRDATLAQQLTTRPARAQAKISIKQGGHWEGKHYKGGSFVNVDAITPPEQYTDHSEWIRYEGPGIESDRVAYRIYLDWRNGFDIFGKRNPGLQLQDIGLDGYDSYHEMADWGADILKVGDSLGMGGFGFWDGEKAARVEQTDARRAAILNSGPIMASMTIEYRGWTLPGHKTDLDATFAMTAGSPLVHVTLETSRGLPNMMAGLGKHEAAEMMTGDVGNGSGWAYLATFGRQTLFDDELGKFILYRKQDAQALVEDQHNYAVVMKGTDSGLDYYFGSVWSGEMHGIKDRGTFEDFLAREIDKLSQPVTLARNIAR